MAACCSAEMCSPVRSVPKNFSRSCAALQQRSVRITPSGADSAQLAQRPARRGCAAREGKRASIGSAQSVMAIDLNTL
jgi:hypothetical protein